MLCGHERGEYAMLCYAKDGVYKRWFESASRIWSVDADHSEPQILKHASLQGKERALFLTDPSNYIIASGTTCSAPKFSSAKQSPYII